jgi:hypothetical protein
MQKFDLSSNGANIYVMMTRRKKNTRQLTLAGKLFTGNDVLSSFNDG